MALRVLQVHRHGQRVPCGELHRRWRRRGGEKDVTADRGIVLGQVGLSVTEEEKEDGGNHHHVLLQHAGRFIEHNIGDETGDGAHGESDVPAVLELQ